MSTERCLWRGEPLRTSLQVLVNPYGITEMFYLCFNIFIQFPNYLHLATRSQRWTSLAQIFISEMAHKSLVLLICTLSLITFFSVPPLRDVYYRENRDGLYSTTTFLLSYSIHVIPFQAVSAFIFSVIVYWLVYIAVNEGQLQKKLMTFLNFHSQEIEFQLSFYIIPMPLKCILATW
jgi:hypothetical protein